jgi:hypothetical protein
MQIHQRPGNQLQGTGTGKERDLPLDSHVCKMMQSSTGGDFPGCPEWSSRASRRTRGTRRTQRNAGACSDPVDELLGGPTCGCSPGCGMCSARSVRCAMRQCQAFPTHRLAFLAYQNVWPLASHQTKRAASSAPARSRARAVGPVDTMPTRTARGAHLWRLVHVSRPQAWRTKTRRSCSSVWTTLARRRSCIG